MDLNGFGNINASNKLQTGQDMLNNNTKQIVPQMVQTGMLDQGLAARGTVKPVANQQPTNNNMPLIASMPNSDMTFAGMTEGLAGMNMLNIQNSKNTPIIGGANLIQ